MAEAKAREEAKRKRLVKKKKKKKKRLAYLQKLQDEVLAKCIVLLKSAKGFQITESKYKEVTPGDEKK